MLRIIRITVDKSTKVIWEEGRVAELSQTYAVKFPLVTMARPKFAAKSTHSRGPIPKPHYLSHPWTRPTSMPNGIRIRSAVFPQCTGQTDARTYVWIERPTDRSRESVTTIGRCAPRATRPNKTTVYKESTTVLFLRLLIISGLWL